MSKEVQKSNVITTKLVIIQNKCLRAIAGVFKVSDDEATINIGIHRELREVPGRVPEQADMGA